MTLLQPDGGDGFAHCPAFDRYSKSVAIEPRSGLKWAFLQLDLFLEQLEQVGAAVEGAEALSAPVDEEQGLRPWSSSTR